MECDDGYGRGITGRPTREKAGLQEKGSVSVKLDSEVNLI